MSVFLPADESGRLSSLRSYHILDTPPELPYDEISELAAQICQCPVAVIGMIDEARDWKKSKYGLPPDFTGLPREMSFCSTTLAGSTSDFTGENYNSLRRFPSCLRV